MGRIWECPTCGDRKRGLTKPRLDATIRFCLGCSAKSDHLVPRVCTTVERAKVAKKINRELREEERSFWGGVDLREVWKLMLQLPGIPERLLRKKPTMKVRRCTIRPRQVGTAWYEEHRVQVSVWKNRPLSHVVETLIHELAHLVTYAEAEVTGHGPRFQRTLEALNKAWRERHPDIPCQEIAA